MYYCMVLIYGRVEHRRNKFRLKLSVPSPFVCWCQIASNPALFPIPPLKFRTSGFPQYGFKCGFRCYLYHKAYRLNLAQIFPATL